MIPEGTKHNTYVIVQPGTRGHATGDPASHLVVDVNEWVQVLHEEKPGYDFLTEHTTYDAAADKRNELNNPMPGATEPLGEEVATA